jgi:hypothetical protein
VCCQVEVSATGRSLVQGSPTECGVSECDHESSTMSRPWRTGGCCAMVKKKKIIPTHTQISSYKINITPACFGGNTPYSGNLKCVT